MTYIQWDEIGISVCVSSAWLFPLSPYVYYPKFEQKIKRKKLISWNDEGANEYNPVHDYI